MNHGAVKKEGRPEGLKIHNLVWVIPIYEDNMSWTSDENMKILLLERKKDDDLYPGMLNLVTGHIEYSEDIAHAAEREFYEEIGTPVKDASYVGSYLCIDGKNVFLMHSYVAFLESTNIKPTEHNNYHLINFDYFIKNIRSYNLTPPEKLTFITHLYDILKVVRARSFHSE